jgi:hypothetical protein
MACKMKVQGEREREVFSPELLQDTVIITNQMWWPALGRYVLLITWKRRQKEPPKRRVLFYPDNAKCSNKMTPDSTRSLSKILKSLPLDAPNLLYYVVFINLIRRYWRPHGVSSSGTWLLGSRVRIPLRTWMFVSYVICCVVLWR